MREQPPTFTHAPWRGRLRILAGVAIAAALLLAVGVVAARRASGRATPPVPVGAPVRVVANGVDGVFLLTSRHRTHVLAGRGRMSPTRWTDLEVDLWHFDPATARPVWGRNVLTERDGQPLDLALLGAEDDVLWLYVRGPLAVRADSGTLRADTARLAAMNPALRGVLPRERRFYALGRDGLRVTTADARTLRVDGATLVAQPVTPGAVGAAGSVAAPPFFAPAATHAFQRRGLQLPERWFGVLAEEEATAFRTASADAAAAPAGERRRALAEHRAAVHAPPPLDATAPLRHRLWGARVTQASRAPAGWPADLPDRWGTRAVYTEIAPLPESPEFLQGGLLAAGGQPAAPIVVRNPDGVLVLHRDRLGEEGRLRLTRVAGPGGRAVWEAALPLSVLQAVLPPTTGGRHLVLYGLAYTPPTGKPRDPHQGAHVVLVSVELATGAVRAWDVTAETAIAAPRVGQEPRD